MVAYQETLRWSLYVAALLLAVSRPGVAQQSSPTPASSEPQACCESMEERFKVLQERIIALEGEVRMLKEAQAAQASAPATPTAVAAESSVPAAGAALAGGQSAGQLPNYGGASALAKILNPDISVIGDFLGSVGGNSMPPGASLSPFPALEMHESEVGFQAIVDPYARADIFLSFGEEGVELEEGYLTFTSLPAGIVAKVGKMRAAFGKVNTLHNHTLPWTDRPLVTENLVAGEEGIDDAGFSITRILPAPKGLFLEATGQLFRGDSGDSTHPLFVSSGKSDVSAVAHLRAYKDITESTNLDIGLSYARGHNDQGPDMLTRLYGVDATFRWKPLRRSIYHSFVARSEFVWSQRQQVPGPTLPTVERAFGFYASGEYQLARRWFLGGRFDWSDRALAARQTDRGGSAILTYWPSDFSQIRGQYRHTSYAEGIRANELLLQVQFILGAHGAHPF